MSAYDKVAEEREKERDYEMCRQGRYYYDALAIALGNVFRKKGTEVHDYMEGPYHILMREKQIETGEIELPEDERKARIKAVFGAMDAQMSAVAQKRRKKD